MIGPPWRILGPGISHDSVASLCCLVPPPTSLTVVNPLANMPGRWVSFENVRSTSHTGMRSSPFNTQVDFRATSVSDNSVSFTYAVSDSLMHFVIFVRHAHTVCGGLRMWLRESRWLLTLSPGTTVKWVWQSINPGQTYNPPALIDKYPSSCMSFEVDLLILSIIPSLSFTVMFGETLEVSTWTTETPNEHVSNLYLCTVWDPVINLSSLCWRNRKQWRNRGRRRKAGELTDDADCYLFGSPPRFSLNIPIFRNRIRYPMRWFPIISIFILMRLFDDLKIIYSFLERSHSKHHDTCSPV